MEKFEISKKNIKESSIFDGTDEEVFKQYLYTLDLKPEDFEKKILDIGSGSGKFAKWAKEHNLSEDIISLDDSFSPAVPGKFVFGQAENLPFADQSFDFVVSLGAVPNSFNTIKNREKRQARIKMTLGEMLRILQPGGEIRIAPLMAEDNQKFHQLFVVKEEFFAELNKLAKKQEIKFSEKRIGKGLLVKIKKIKPGV